MHPALRKISCGLEPDLPLADADLAASAAWAAALGRCGALTPEDAELLEATLSGMREDLQGGAVGPLDDGASKTSTRRSRPR